MQTLVLVVHVLAAVLLIGLVLVQHGQGADAGAAFGSGASQTVFGSRGAGSFLTRLTTGLAVIFFITSMTLAYLSQDNLSTGSVLDQPAGADGRQAGSPAPQVDSDLQKSVGGLWDSSPEESAPAEPSAGQVQDPAAGKTQTGGVRIPD